MKISGRRIGQGHPCYIIAEVSCNHEGDFEEAVRIVEAAAKCGVDAVKLQTYRADTLTGRFKFQAKETMWSSVDLFDLYEKAFTPWEWHGRLQEVATQNGLTLFSSPFDETAVDFLLEQGCPALKVASFEVVDTKLLEKIGRSGVAVLMSSGMTSFSELDDGVRTLRRSGCSELALFHCNSGYPASFDEANLKTIPALKRIYDVPVGLSDHIIFGNDQTFSNPAAHVSPVEAVKLGADLLEVHLTLDRERARTLYHQNEGGFDWAFSRNPDELERTVELIRRFEREGAIEYESEFERECARRAQGEVSFEPTPKELKSRTLRPSLWVVREIRKGEPFVFAPEHEEGNFDSLRPADGLSIRFADVIANCRAASDIPAGVPLAWGHVEI